MSLIKNLTESERIQKMQDRMLYANYIISRGKYEAGLNPYPAAIESGSGASKESSVLINIRLGQAYTTALESSVILADNVTLPPTILPGAPTGVTGTPQNTQAFVSWTASSTNGGDAITLYTVTSSPGGKTATSTTTSVLVSGLTNATAYTFTVTASSRAGNSVASIASTAVTPNVMYRYKFNDGTISGGNITNAYGGGALAFDTTYAAIDTTAADLTGLPTGATGCLKFTTTAITTTVPLTMPITITNTMSYSFWIKTPQGGRQFLMLSDGTRVVIEAWGNRIVQGYGTSYSYDPLTTAYPNSTWTHYAITWSDATNVKYYINGTLSQSLTSTELNAPVTTGSRNLTLGGAGYPPGSSTYMYDFIVVPYTLTAAQVASIYNGN